MKKSWKLLPKILRGEKIIESRWYKNKSSPWNKIREGEFVYFKDLGNPVSVKSEVKKVMQFSNLDSNKVREILGEYGKDDGLDEKDIPLFFNLFRDKNYCILIYLKNPKKIEPFEINKKGFGLMSAWLVTENINKLRI